jgi:membrane-anchored protein YejM (alkaline phosphatase superfamily)
MTTSNHRPYTYPEGRIDIPSGSGREGAVKYTDYAIGEFLRQAKTKPWFDRTVFVFVADHNAGSAGKQDLPIENYHIPLFVYSPANIPAAEVSTVASQIDLAPTLLGLLQVDYTSTFFGRDLLSGPPWPGRAVIGNYQHLGLYDGERLFILSPRQGLREVKSEDGSTVRATLDESGIRRAVAYYQGASALFRQRRLGPLG